jgi:hypothetical protein
MSEDFLTGLICPYCGCGSRMVIGDFIYTNVQYEGKRPKFLGKLYYQCLSNPDHFVGTYKDNKRSLGRIADADLRKWKQLGHRTFDPLWKEMGIFATYKEAYLWLAGKMGISLEHTHFGMFTKEQCQIAIQYCNELLDNQVQT